MIGLERNNRHSLINGSHTRYNIPLFSTYIDVRVTDTLVHMNQVQTHIRWVCHNTACSDRPNSTVSVQTKTQKVTQERQRFNKKEARGKTGSHTQHSRTNLKIPSLYDGCSKSIKTGTISPVRTGTQGRDVSRARSGLSRPVRTWHTRCSISHSHVTPDKDRQYLIFVALRITEKTEQKVCKNFVKAHKKTCTEI